MLTESREGMELVGKRLGDGVYFLPELVYSAEIFKQLAGILKPKLKAEVKTGKAGKAIVGIVAGDFYNIGKDIVVFMLEMNGFEVFDVVANVPPQKLAGRIRVTNASIVALSGFLTLVFDSMKETIDVMKTDSQGSIIVLSSGKIRDLS